MSLTIPSLRSPWALSFWDLLSLFFRLIEMEESDETLKGLGEEHCSYKS